MGTGSVDAASYSTIRVLSGALMLLLIVGMRERSWTRGMGGDWSSAFYLFLYTVPFSFAYNGLTTGTGALILFGCVQLTMLLVAWRSGERPSIVQWAGLVIALGGLVYLLVPGLHAPPPLPALLMGLAGAAWGLYTLRGRGTGDPLQRTAGNFTRALPMVVVISLLAWPTIRVEWRGALLAVISGAGASALGYVAWYAALKHLSTTHASTLQLLVPILAAVAGVLVLAEPFGLRLGLSTLLVLGGVGLTLWTTGSTDLKYRSDHGRDERR
jgi:drug/metabolite transporter (DMT)-like permease